jgi:predicted pyridoxine 5'-phosphate oxidase superfamily flavin-nucleotide-binding protein
VLNTAAFLVFIKVITNNINSERSLHDFIKQLLLESAIGITSSCRSAIRVARQQVGRSSGAKFYNPSVDHETCRQLQRTTFACAITGHFLDLTAYTLTSIMSTGWHPGELAIQRKLGYEEAMRWAWRDVEDSMPDLFREFNTTRLPFIPVSTLDSSGRPWGAIMAGKTGTPGFARSPNEQTMIFNARSWDGDPMLQTVEALLEKDDDEGNSRYLSAGIGIDFSTRMRTKFGGWLTSARRKDIFDFEVTLRVNEALG